MPLCASDGFICCVSPGDILNPLHTFSGAENMTLPMCGHVLEPTVSVTRQRLSACDRRLLPSVRLPEMSDIGSVLVPEPTSSAREG